MSLAVQQHELNYYLRELIDVALTDVIKSLFLGLRVQLHNSSQIERNKDARSHADHILFSATSWSSQQPSEVALRVFYNVS